MIRDLSTSYLTPALFIVLFWALIIICILRIMRYFNRASKEQQLMRMELGKIAEEVRLIKEQFGKESPKNSSAKSPSSSSQ